MQPPNLLYEPRRNGTCVTLLRIFVRVRSASPLGLHTIPIVERILTSRIVCWPTAAHRVGAHASAGLTDRDRTRSVHTRHMTAANKLMAAAATGQSAAARTAANIAIRRAVHLT